MFSAGIFGDGGSVDYEAIEARQKKAAAEAEAKAKKEAEALMLEKAKTQRGRAANMLMEESGKKTLLG